MPVNKFSWMDILEEQSMRKLRAETPLPNLLFNNKKVCARDFQPEFFWHNLVT
jgi:hypothetical protein